MSEFPPYRVYKTLPVFLKYRGLTVDPKFKWKKRDPFVAELKTIKYNRTDAKTSEGKMVFIYILYANGKYSIKGPELKELLTRSTADSNVKEGKLEEVIVVANEEFFRKKNMVDVIRKLRNQTGEQRFSRYYNAYPYHVLAFPVPEAASVPSYGIVTPKQAKKFLESQHYRKPSDVPIIFASDPPIVWLGARPGQFVLIERLSQTTGTTFCLKRVKAGVLMSQKKSRRKGPVRRPS